MKKYKNNLVLNNSFIKFLIVGGISTAIDFIVYMLISIRIDISLSKCISMVVSCSFSFIFNKYWTFSDKEKTTFIRLAKYIFVQIINILANVEANKFVYDISGSKVMAFFFATIIAMIVNYTLQKSIVFRKRDR